jgi:uncharacterized cupin superfamily protein
LNRPIVNIAEIEVQPLPAAFAASGASAERYDARMGHIAPRLGAKQLGYNITALSPGKRAFPFRNHRINEEMFFVLEGVGEIRIGDATYPIRAGDIIACPAGGKDSAHQIINSGENELRYLAVSTKMSPEIAEYPDSGKFCVVAEYPADPQGRPGRFRFVGREELGIDYWEGEWYKRRRRLVRSRCLRRVAPHGGRPAHGTLSLSPEERPRGLAVSAGCAEVAQRTADVTRA